MTQKKSAPVLFVLLVLLIVSVSQGADTAWVFLLGGQSNMLGDGTDTATLVDSLKVIRDDILFFPKRENSIIPLQPDYGGEDGRGGFGPELSFGHAIADAWSHRQIALIKSSHGQTALCEHWDPATGGSYAAFIQKKQTGLDSLRARGFEPVVCAMLWQQGESDAHKTLHPPSCADQYGTNLANMLESVRTAVNTPDMALIIARTHYMQKSNFPYIDIVREGQESVANTDPHAAYFSTDDLLDSTEIHFHNEEVIENGYRFAETYLALTNTATGITLLRNCPAPLYKTANHSDMDHAVRHFGINGRLLTGRFNSMPGIEIIVKSEIDQKAVFKTFQFTPEKK